MGIELGRTTGKINLTNATGNIELNASAENVELTNSSDNIELNGVAGDIELVIKGGGSSVEIDDTLSIAGAAADAAATGEALGKLEAQPDWLEEDTTKHSYIQNKPMGTKRVAYMSSDDKTDFTIGANLILEIQKSYAKFFTYEYMNSDTESYSTNIVFYTFAWGMELELNVVNLTKFDDSNLEQVLDSTNGLKVVVINNRDILSDELKEKYPVMGVYFDFDTQAAIDKKTVIRARVDTVQYYRLSKNYLPTDVAYLSDIPEPGGDAVEVDATLSIEGAAADAKATGDAIISLGDNTVGKTYYSIDMETLKNNGVLVAATNISSNGLTIAISLLPCIFENGVEYKIIDMPFKYMYFNGAVLTNRNSFTNVGIQSPVITQQLGIDRVLWIDTLYKIMCNFPDVNESGNFSFGDDSQAYHPEAVIKIEFNVCGSSTPLNQLRGLWEAIFATPGTKIVFEYQNQENIETVEAEYLYGTTPAPISL